MLAVRFLMFESLNYHLLQQQVSKHKNCQTVSSFARFSGRCRVIEKKIGDVRTRSLAMYSEEVLQKIS